MAKYSLEFKLEVVQEYLNGEGSYDYIAKKHNMPACSLIKEWVAIFRKLGKEGLMRSGQYNTNTIICRYIICSKASNRNNV